VVKQKKNKKVEVVVPIMKIKYVTT